MYEDTTITLHHDEALRLALLLRWLEDWLNHSTTAVEDLVEFLTPKFKFGVFTGRMHAEAITADVGFYGQKLSIALWGTGLFARGWRVKPPGGAGLIQRPVYPDGSRRVS
jgi:hypothetical protein